MLISTYDPNAEAVCPKCGFVKCMNTYGNLAFPPRYMDFRHEECGTEWRIHIGEGRVEVLSDPETITG